MYSRFSFAAVLLVFAGVLSAQQAPVQAGAVRDPAVKRALPIADYARWRSITSPLISSNGMWVAWVYTQLRRDDQLHVREVDSNRDFTVDRGSRPVFSDDGRWVAYSVAAASVTTGRGAVGRGGRGGAGSTPPAGASTTPPRAELMNLETGEKVAWDGVASFEFSKGSAFLAVQRARPTSSEARKFDGVDLILRDLKNNTDRHIGSVADHAFNKTGTMLAWTVDADGTEGNGVYVSELGTGIDRVLDNAKERYSRLTWSDSGTALAALRGNDADTLAQRVNTLVAFTGVTAGNRPSRIEISPTTSGISASFVISDKAALSWNDRADRLFFGVKSQDVKPRKRDDDAIVAPSDVDIYHAADDRIQSVQRSQANTDRNRTDRAVLDVATKRAMKLTDSTMRTVQVTRDGRWVVAIDDHKYISDWQEPRADTYRIDATTGERTQILTAAADRSLGLSPDSRFFIYWKDKHVWAYDLAANKHVNLTAKTPVSFVNAEDDHMAEKPAYGVAGFSKDGKYLVLDHRYDVWLVPLDGSGAARNLTNGVGTKNEMRLRYQRTETADQAPAVGGGGRGGQGSTTVIDLEKPILFTAYGDLTKKAGFYTLDGGQLREIVYRDKAFSFIDKADNADRVLITREDWTEYPDLQVSDLQFGDLKKVTDANPQQAEYKWGHRILFDYKDRDGHKLQGTLAIPDERKPGERLPMLVNFYEKNSQNLHRYQTPRYPGSTPSFSAFVSNGYLVMQPDVYFHGRTSHQDMLESVEAAVRKVVELGYADAAHVGLQGHSYSGGGSAYIAGHSKMFAAVNSGAAPIDLTTEFNTLFRGSGQNNASYDIRGQGRYGTDPYTDPKLYYDQSPISGVLTMNTPLLQMQGDNDQTVEWLQGVEWYNALRFNKKPVIFLSYPGEDHGLRKLENQVDYGIRQIEFFDHYLKGAPAPAWMTQGERFIDKDKRTPVRINVEKPRSATSAADKGGR